jgi:hypothetical protein
MNASRNALITFALIGQLCTAPPGQFTMKGAGQIAPPVLIVSAGSGGSLKLLGAASVAGIGGDRLELVDDPLCP